jgi:hypothetical protein
MDDTKAELELEAIEEFPAEFSSGGKFSYLSLFGRSITPPHLRSSTTRTKEAV